MNLSNVYIKGPPFCGYNWLWYYNREPEKLYYYKKSQCFSIAQSDDEGCWAGPAALQISIKTVLMLLGISSEVMGSLLYNKRCASAVWKWQIKKGGRRAQHSTRTLLPATLLILAVSPLLYSLVVCVCLSCRCWAPQQSTETLIAAVQQSVWVCLAAARFQRLRRLFTFVYNVKTG